MSNARASKLRPFATVGGRELPTEITAGTGSAALTTRQSFFTNASDRASFGKLRRSEGPYGNWTENEYNPDGLLSSVRSGWLAGGADDPCRRVVYSYSPVFSETNAPAGLPVDDGAAERTTPRVETVYVGGVPVEKTLRAIHKDKMGYIRVETVRLLDPTVKDGFAAWTDPANPHSLAIYMPQNYGKPCSKLPWLVVNPDGTATSYDYISGDYVPGADGTPGTFTEVQGGQWFRTIATHGTAGKVGPFMESIASDGRSFVSDAVSHAFQIIGRLPEENRFGTTESTWRLAGSLKKDEAFFRSLCAGYDEDCGQDGR